MFISVVQLKLPLVFKIKAVLFDLDGTLIEPRLSFAEAALRTLRLLGLGSSMSVSEVVKLMCRPFSEVLSVLAPQVSLNRDVKLKVLETYAREYGGCLRYVELKPGAEELLEELRDYGVKTAVVTNRSWLVGYVKPTLRVLGLEGLVDAVVTILDVARCKPAPDPVFEACRRLEVPCYEAVVVGDSPEDLRCGRAAGSKTVAYTGGFNSRELLEAEGPNAVICELRELIDVLRSL